MKIQDIKNNVVVPFDFSDLSRKGLEQAVEMVDPSLIRVVHVTDYPTAYEYGVVWEMITEETITQRLKESFKKATEASPALKNLALELNVLFGIPGVQIAEFAQEQNADLIIMPSHGRSGVKRLLLGSVAERVLHHADCPVFVLRSDDL